MVLVLLLIVCLVALGFACICGTHHAAQSVEKAFAQPALTAMWSFVIVLLATGSLYGQRQIVARARPSPELLQRFIF